MKLYRSRTSADGKPCPYCRRIMSATASIKSGLRPTRDHIRPRVDGGTLRNKLICCAVCNNDKGGLSIWDWHTHLRAKGDRRADHVLEVIVALYTYLGHDRYADAVGTPSDGVWFP